MPTDYKRVLEKPRERNTDIANRRSVGAHSFESEKTTIEVPESVVQSERKVDRNQFRESHRVFVDHRRGPHSCDGIQKYQITGVA